MLFLMFIVIILMFIFLPDSSKDEVDRRHKEQDLRREDEDYIRKLKERSVGNPYLNLPKNLLTNDYRKISPKQVELTMKQVDSLSGRDFEILSRISSARKDTTLKELLIPVILEQM
jgi:hypothetical protein